MKNFIKILGGALLVAGTSVGAGMLALPVVSAMGGFFPSILIYVVTWIVMTATGFLYLEIALNMPKDSNIISMAEKYLGKTGKVFSWIVYIFLFYCLSIAYISGGAGLIQSVFSNLSLNVAALIFVLFFGFFVYRGAFLVDKTNFVLMIGLIVSYFLFIFLGIKHVHVSYLKFVDFKHVVFILPVVLTSFGYQGIMPSLTYYMKKDAKKIKTSIVLGTTIAFGIYVLWEFLIMSIIPIEGKFSLKETLILGKNVIEPMKYHTKAKNIYAIGQFFSFFAITTSFLGVSLGLFDFLADGFKITKKGVHKLAIAFLTFLPPALITLINPNLFITALNYAGGIGGTLLLVLLPCLLVYSARYVKKDDVKRQLLGGKSILFLIILFSLFVLAIKIIQGVINITA